MLGLEVHLYEDLPDWIVNVLEPTLFWISVVMCLFVAIIFYRHYKTTEVGKPFSFGLLAFALCFFIARTLENYRKYFLASNRMNIVRWWAYGEPAIVGTELIIRIMYYIFSWVAIAIFYYSTEKYVFQAKTKYIFTISSLFEGSVSIALYFTEGTTREVFQVFATIGFFLCAVAPILLYLNMALKGTGVIKKSSFITTFGLTFFVVGVLGELPESQFVSYLVTGQFLDAYVIAVVSPISMMLGFVLLVVGYKQMFSRLF